MPDISPDLKQENSIFTYICDSDNTDAAFLKLINILENKVKSKIIDKEVTDILKNYNNININNKWIIDKYQDLLIINTTENLITDKILAFYVK